MKKLKQYTGRLARAGELRLYAALFGYLAKWLFAGSIVGILAGSASALFLASLSWATHTRETIPWLLLLLPVGGVLVSFIFMKLGQGAAGGTNLILDEIHDGNGRVPLRMAPLVLFGTVVTHLFGGSAGREGTAVQMGGSLADWVSRRLRLDNVDRKLILMCGISGGFGSVFGTPLAGTVFALEVLAIGMIRHQAFIPCLIASLVGNAVTAAWGIPHIHLDIGAVPELSVAVAAKVALASVLFGLTSRLFSGLIHRLKKWMTALFANPMIRSFTGGLAVIGLVYIAGTRDYLGLSLPLMAQSFEQEMSPFAFLWKLIFTVATLAAGFQGGEVTPLFVIGASLGSALSGFLSVSAPFLAALGLVAVFCGATNTPIACFILGIELFGSEAAIYFMIACAVSYLFSGHTGIYGSQRIGTAKSRLLSASENTALSPGPPTKNRPFRR